MAIFIRVLAGQGVQIRLGGGVLVHDFTRQGGAKSRHVDDGLRRRPHDGRDPLELQTVLRDAYRDALAGGSRATVGFPNHVHSGDLRQPVLHVLKHLGLPVSVIAHHRIASTGTCGFVGRGPGVEQAAESTTPSRNIRKISSPSANSMSVEPR